MSPLVGFFTIREIFNMPFYRFKCKQGHYSDLRQKYEDDAPACFKCGEPTKRVIGAPAFRFGADPHDAFHKKAQANGEIE